MKVPVQSSRKYCKTCLPKYERDRQRAYYQKNVENGRIEKYRRKARERQRLRQEDDRVRLIDRAKHRAKAKGVKCSLRVEDIKIPSECPVLRKPFKKNTEYAMSIDAIDPSGDYTADNIQIISMKANAMKNSATREELKLFAEWILTKVVREPDVPEITR